MSIINLTPVQLRKAADLQEKIAKLQSELTAIFGNEYKATSTAKPAKKKGGMSAAGKAKIAAAQKLRWAKVKAAKATPKAATKPAKKKFVMSPAAKAKISAAAKARWAAKKAADVKK